MQIDFSSIEDPEDFCSVPEGVYACRVADVRAGTTREGAPKWSLRLEVLDGDFAGRTAAWDNLVWSERGLPRARHVLGSLGFEVQGPIELEPNDLIDRHCRVQVVPEEREDPRTGRRAVRPRVPYLGYDAA